MEIEQIRRASTSAAVPLPMQIHMSTATFDGADGATRRSSPPIH
jgi:hypothetical protein